MFHFVLLSLFPRIDITIIIIIIIIITIIIIIIIIIIIKREWSIKTLFVAQLIRIISWTKLPADMYTENWRSEKRS